MECRDCVFWREDDPDGYYCYVHETTKHPVELAAVTEHLDDEDKDCPAFSDGYEG